MTALYHHFAVTGVMCCCETKCDPMVIFSAIVVVLWSAESVCLASLWPDPSYDGRT